MKQQDTEPIGFAAVEVKPWPESSCPCFLCTVGHRQRAGLCFSFPPPRLADAVIGAWPGCLAAEAQAIWLAQLNVQGRNNHADSPVERSSQRGIDFEKERCDHPALPLASRLHRQRWQAPSMSPAVILQARWWSERKNRKR